MARAEAASASARSDSIKGLAQSIAKPAYRRLLTAEPALRRAVPALIVAFLLTIGVGAVVQVLDQRRQAIGEAIGDIGTTADFVSERYDRLAQSAPTGTAPRDLLDRALSARALASGRRVLLSNPEGQIVGAAPSGSLVGTRLIDALGDTQPLTILGASAGVMEIALGNGVLALATVRTLASGRGQIAVYQSRDDALARWRAETTLTVTLTATTGFVLLILGFAFHWQATRAREADAIYDTVRSRIDTALNRGRCGLWDWDLARGRIFWSHSMFAILGIAPRDDLMTFGEVSRLVHPDDIRLYEIAAQLADAKASAIDHEFRMLHASGKWVWLRARCELVPQRGDSGQHLIGIAVDITEQKSLVEKTAAADLRLRDAIETVPETFVLWDHDNRLVLCNSNFQRMHNLPDETVAAGTPYEDVVAAGRKHVVRTNVTNDDAAIPGAHTFEAQLDDGHWLQISERRTKDGGYVSVGTDITPLKLHEKKLVDSEQRLMATVADLRNSQHKLEIQTRQLTDMAQKYSEEKNRAEEANQAKSKFMANMSHELRTPLNAIIGFSEIMESGMFGALGADKYHEYCRDIRESGQYLLDVINDILDMSKIEAGRLKLDREEVELDRVLADALRVVTARAQDKQLQVTSQIAPNVRFKADRRAIKQIALNLLSNAVKFTQENGSITVRGRYGRGGVTIGIQDSGIGIPRNALKKLGKPFEQVESQLTKTQQGSGLGLAIAKSLVELHGGTMRIRSAPGIGTTVVVRLPIDAPASDANGAQSSPHAA
ncbi:MAG: PAS domain-containing sensor histidine kinase [Alphaproteobacteria bacterium]|nr:PAS domain-containing sensor histidine kinase [Alphaproteobacteria bacterium]